MRYKHISLKYLLLRGYGYSCNRNRLFNFGGSITKARRGKD